MKKILFILAAAATVFAACTSPGNKPGLPEKVKPSRNVIFMLTDGTSTSLFATARWYQRYMKDSLDKPLYLDPYICGLVQSRLSDAIIPDSAPGMSGYMCGVPSRVGNISIYPEPHPGQDVLPTNPDKAWQPAATVLEAAKIKKGKAVGMVVTTIFPHATPAATAAHSALRSRYHDLGRQIASQDLDVMFGGGTGILDDDMRSVIRANGATLLEDDVEAFRAAKEGKVWALFNENIMDFEIDRDPSDEPSLSEMTAKAIDILSKDKDGFFLMIEGSKVDYGAHSKDPVEAITEFIEFDKAFKVALDFARKDGNTTIVVTSDHGNSGITLGDARYRQYAAKGLDSMFVGIKNCHTSSYKMANLLKECRESEIMPMFKEHTGIDLKPSELNAIKSCMTRVEGDYMQVSSSSNLQSVICGIYTTRTHIGFTSGNHTGEDVFLAVYNPRGERPLGMLTNTQLNDYVCRELGFPSRTELEKLTGEIYVSHLQLFDGCGLEVVPGEEYPTLFVRKDGRQLRIPAFQSRVYYCENDGAEREVSTPCPAVYMVENGQFYLDRSLGDLFE